MRSHCPTWRVETPTNRAISSRDRPSSLQRTAESRWKIRRSWACRRRSPMSFRCRGVNWIVFITPSHHPHGSNQKGVPPLSPWAIVGSSGPARLYLCEAAWHHADLSVTWGKVWVKLKTHSAGGITDKDFALARKIEEVVLWRPEAGSPLEGTPDKFVQAKK